MTKYNVLREKNDWVLDKVSQKYNYVITRCTSPMYLVTDLMKMKEEIRETISNDIIGNELKFYFSTSVDFPRRKFSQVFPEWKIVRKSPEYVVVGDRVLDAYMNSEMVHKMVSGDVWSTDLIGRESPRTTIEVPAPYYEIVAKEVETVYTYMKAGAKCILLDTLMKYDTYTGTRQLTKDEIIVMSKLLGGTHEDKNVALSLMDGIDIEKYIDELTFLFEGKLWLLTSRWHKFLRSKIENNIISNKWKVRLLERIQ